MFFRIMWLILSIVGSTLMSLSGYGLHTREYWVWLIIVLAISLIMCELDNKRK